MDLNVCKTSYLVFLMVESISIFIVTNNGKKLLGKKKKNFCQKFSKKMYI